MAKLKLSKQSLQKQRELLKLYKRLLPSLDLKRRQLTVETQKARQEYAAAQAALEELDTKIGTELPMLASSEMDLTGLVKKAALKVGEQNLVGVKLPLLEQVEVEVAGYSRLATPAWIDVLVERLKKAAEERVRVEIAGERARILEQATRRITQRVNLFDKILIPTTKKNIQRIQIFLGDADRAAVVTSKIAKAKQAEQRELARPGEAVS
jgi:V/A-type H+-transporting ATPase subunit D